jgi:hypothetical protein
MPHTDRQSDPTSSNCLTESKPSAIDNPFEAFFEELFSEDDGDDDKDS